MADETGSPADQEAVGEVLLKLGTAFRTLDASGLEQIYADDADWTNAFGITKKGAGEIVAYLRDLFANPEFAAGDPVGPPQASMRFVAADIAVVKTYIERAGQQAASGEQLPVRRNHSLKVLRREGEAWKIVSEIYMDAHDESLRPFDHT